MKRPEQILDEASRWWDTSIIDVHPGSISIRGYPIQQLIGGIDLPQMVWLMVRGELPTAEEAHLLEAALVAGVDHGPHAPSIAIARMAVTCGLPVNGAMSSAIDVLDDIDGGAGQQSMELFREIDGVAGGAPDVAAAAEAVLRKRMEAGESIVPGFGHRFHPVDPRAAPLLKLVEEARIAGTIEGRFVAIGLAVQNALADIKRRLIPMNVDGVTAVVLCELGFEPELGRGLFILSRAVGILAHAWEQKQQGQRVMGPMPKDIPYHHSSPQARAYRKEAT